MLERLPEWVNADAGLVRRGRYLSTIFPDGDFRDRVSEIDTAQCPLYLLTGEYDFSCTPADTERTAAKIKGARVTVMKEIGRRYILPVLEEIRARG